MTTHRILVVDDEPLSVRAVARAVATEGQVMTATHAAEAFRLLATTPVAVVIVDQRMPDMVGTDLLARCAAQHPDVVRVLLTGYTDVDTLLGAINAGHVFSYLTKPWEPHELRLVVRRAIERYAVETDRRRLLGEMQEACRRAAREAQQKTRLLSLAAHELGTPVHIIAHGLAFLAEETLSLSGRRWLDAARRGAEWLGLGVAQLLHGARGGARRLNCIRRPLQADVVVREAVDAVRCRLGTRRLALQMEAVLPCPAVLADPVWLERAVVNLLTNAVRFTPDGGAVSVTVGPAGGAVRIGVRDTGVGIDAAALGEIFEPFSRACGDVALHASGGFEFGARGLGLGLSITRAIVEQHDGTIGARSQPGAGSEFTIALPACGRPDEGGPPTDALSP